MKYTVTAGGLGLRGSVASMAEAVKALEGVNTEDNAPVELVRFSNGETVFKGTFGEMKAAAAGAKRLRTAVVAGPSGHGGTNGSLPWGSY